MFSKLLKKIFKKRKPNAFVVISGNMIKNSEGVDEIANIAIDYDVTVCVGAGQQINDFFKKRKLSVEFCPVGRICKTRKQKQIAKMLLYENKRIIEKALRRAGVQAKIILPIVKIGDKLCHVNTDLMALNAYVSYDQIFIITMRAKAWQKEAWVKSVVDIFSTSMTEIKNLDKIQICPQ